MNKEEFEGDRRGGRLGRIWTKGRGMDRAEGNDAEDDISATRGHDGQPTKLGVVMGHDIRRRKGGGNRIPSPPFSQVVEWQAVS